MLRKSMNKLQEVLIFILVCILLGVIYYQFIYKRVENAKVQYDTTDLETQIMNQQMISMNIRNMKQEIAENKKENTGVIITYNNLKAEINELNDIFGGAEDFSFGFDQAVATDDAVRRNVNASFTAMSYWDAKEMLQQLHDSPYRCIINDVNITSTTVEDVEGDEKNLADGPVAVSFTVTFFETLYNAKTTEGLAYAEGSNSGSSESLTQELADSKERAESTGSEY